MQTRFCFSKFRRYCRNTGIFLGQDSIPRLKTTAQLDATRQTTNNSFRRNLSKVICMPFCLRRFHPYTIYSPFFLGDSMLLLPWPPDAKATNMTLRCICIKMAAWTKSWGFSPRRDFTAMLRQPCVSLTHSQNQGQLDPSIVTASVVQ